MTDKHSARRLSTARLACSVPAHTRMRIMLCCAQRSTPPPGGGGGGGHFHIYAYWGRAARETPHFQPWSDLNFRSGAYHFHKFPPNPFRSITILQILGGFCRSGDYHFQNPFRSITILHFLAKFAVPESIIFAFGSAAGPQPARAPAASWQFRRVGFFTLKTALARSGAPHFQAQNGSNSFRRPPFSRSTGSSFRSPCYFCLLCRGTYLSKFGVSTPPPHPPGVQSFDAKKFLNDEIVVERRRGS